MTRDKIYTLIVSSHQGTISHLQRIFAPEKNYYVQFVPSSQDALQIAAQDILDLDVLIIDDTLADVSSLETIRKLAILVPSTPIVALAEQSAVTYVREALLAGARAFITKPLHDSEVINTLDRLIQTERIRTEKIARLHPHTNPKQQCEIYTVISPKGGVGCTLLAVNLAVAIREQTGRRVTLVDGQSALGDLETALNLTAQFTGGDILGHGANLDADLVTGVLTEHASGVQVFASSRNPEDSDAFDSETFEKVIYYLSRRSDYLIIDAGTIFESQTNAALQLASKVILVTTPEITALRRLTYFVQAAENSDFPVEKFALVVNRYDVQGGVGVDDVAQTLNMRVAESFPNDVGLATYSLNRGIPLVQSNPKSALGRRLLRFAKQLAPQPQKTKQAASTSSLLGRLSMKWRNSPT